MVSDLEERRACVFSLLPICLSCKALCGCCIQSACRALGKLPSPHTKAAHKSPGTVVPVLLSCLPPATLYAFSHLQYLCLESLLTGSLLFPATALKKCSMYTLTTKSACLSVTFRVTWKWSAIQGLLCLLFQSLPLHPFVWTKVLGNEARIRNVGLPSCCRVFLDFPPFTGPQACFVPILLMASSY